MKKKKKKKKKKGLSVLNKLHIFIKIIYSKESVLFTDL